MCVYLHQKMLKKKRYPVTLEDHSVYFLFNCIWQEGGARFYYMVQAIFTLESFCLPSSILIVCTTSLTGKAKERAWPL